MSQQQGLPSWPALADTTCKAHGQPGSLGALPSRCASHTLLGTVFGNRLLF